MYPDHENTWSSSLFKGCPIEIAIVTGDPTGQPRDTALETIFYRADRVRFIYWGRFSGAKATVGLVAVVTILSFVTGLSTMSQPEVMLDGPIAPLIPAVETIVRFGGVLSAFVLAIVTFGLSRRKRLAWYVAIAILPLTVVLPLLTLQSTHFPIFILSLLGIPLLVLNRSQFNEALDLTPLQIASLSSIIGVLAYGTIGSYAIRDQFVEINTWSDSFYFVLVTIATVGYGDITPMTTQAQWFSLSVILFGVGAFTTAIGALIVPAIEKRMASAVGNMTPSSLALLEDHIIILGYSEITETVLEVLGDDTDLVVVTPDSEVATRLDDEEVNVLTADPSSVQTLRDAGGEYARGVIAGTNDDAQDILAILAMREINPDVRIVAAANKAHNAEKFRRVGADHVISPTVIGGKLLGRSVLGDEVIQEMTDEWNDEPVYAEE